MKPVFIVFVALLMFQNVGAQTLQDFSDLIIVPEKSCVLGIESGAGLRIQGVDDGASVSVENYMKKFAVLPLLSAYGYYFSGFRNAYGVNISHISHSGKLNNAAVNLSEDMSTWYFGASALHRFSAPEDHWLFDMKYGLGALVYHNKTVGYSVGVNTKDYSGTVPAAFFGLMVSKKINDKLALTGGADLIIGINSKIKNYWKTADQSEDVSRIELKVGIQYNYKIIK